MGWAFGMTLVRALALERHKHPSTCYIDCFVVLYAIYDRRKHIQCPGSIQHSGDKDRHMKYPVVKFVMRQGDSKQGTAPSSPCSGRPAHTDLSQPMISLQLRDAMLPCQSKLRITASGGHITDPIAEVKGKHLLRVICLSDKGVRTDWSQPLVCRPQARPGSNAWTCYNCRPHCGH